MAIFNKFFKKKNIIKFERGEKVLISNNVDDIIEKQKKCGGYSETNMKCILGSVGEVVCDKSECVTVEVNKRQFDLHPDLLKSLNSASSLPTSKTHMIIIDTIQRENNSNIESSLLNGSILSHLPKSTGKYFNNGQRSESLPDPPIDIDSIFYLCDPPFDENLENSPKIPSKNSIYSTKFNDYLVSNDENASIMYPPIDEEEMENIQLDFSIKMVTIELPSDKSHYQDFLNIQFDSPISSISIPPETPYFENSKNINAEFTGTNQNEERTLLDSEIYTIPIPSEKPVLYTAFTNHNSRQILCQYCKENTIEARATCGHCYCEDCIKKLMQCIVCKREIDKDYLRIFL